MCKTRPYSWYIRLITPSLGCLRSMTALRQQSPAKHMLMFWLWLSVQTFWMQIFNSLSGIFGEEVEPDALGALFGVFPSLPSLSKSKRHVLAFVMLLARGLILIKWKSPTPPTHTHWLKDIRYFLKLEKFRLSLRGSSDKFEKVWGPFFHCVRRIHFHPSIPD